MARARCQGELPKQQAFGAANGGEFRKSFHGFAPGYAQVIDSPTEFQITPMQSLNILKVYVISMSFSHIIYTA